MHYHSDLTAKNLFVMMKKKSICYAGNAGLKIFGMLDCTSGSRMKKVNRVFFKSKAEAIASGFRPCGHCMRMDYRKWKNRQLTFS